MYFGKKKKAITLRKSNIILSKISNTHTKVNE